VTESLRVDSLALRSLTQPGPAGRLGFLDRVWKDRVCEVTGISGNLM